MTDDGNKNRELAGGPKRGRPAELNDSWLLDLVDDPKTDRVLSELVVAEAVEERGMEPEEAERLFLRLSPESGDRQSRPHPSHASPRFPTGSPSHASTHASPRFREEPEIEIEDLYRMMSDIMTGKTKPHIETAAGWKAWRTLEREIAEIKAQGGVVDFPAI